MFEQDKDKGVISKRSGGLIINEKRRIGMVRLLGMRLLTRLLLLVCSLSLVSLLFLSRCGLNNLEPEIEDQETQAALPGSRISDTTTVPATKSLGSSNLDCWE
ncbi:hypothetical protein FQA39_LY16936 [Lamprigera yunnana]|nr:hypothetical protein FQA39_LY16936 [Lamprigera yunnana]